MQEIRYDGTEHLTPNVSRDQVERALADVRNASIALHKPGAVFDSWQGRVRKRYRVDADGTLQRLTLDGRPWPAEVIDPPAAGAAAPGAAAPGAAALATPTVEQLAARLAAVEARIQPPASVIAPPSRDDVQRYGTPTPEV